MGHGVVINIRDRDPWIIIWESHSTFRIINLSWMSINISKYTLKQLILKKHSFDDIIFNEIIKDLSNDYVRFFGEHVLKLHDVQRESLSYYT